MLKNRLIPVVLLRNGVVVQSKGFQRHQLLGNPVAIVQRLSDWASDELIYLDISRERIYDLRRDDLKAENRTSLLEILTDVSRCCFMPLTFGGGIRTLVDVTVRLRAGADKISINTKPLENPSFITACAREFGAQCVVVSIDVRRCENGVWEVFSCGGKKPTGRTPSAWAMEAESRGAGEILINSIDRDGRGNGYDIELIESIVNTVSIPVIALGGVGQWEHFSEALTKTKVSAIAAANIFHYTENSVFKAKKFLFEAGANVRKPLFGVDYEKGRSYL